MKNKAWVNLLLDYNKSPNPRNISFDAVSTHTTAFNNEQIWLTVKKRKENMTFTSLLGEEKIQ